MKTKSQIQAGNWYTLKQSRDVRVVAQTKQRFRQFARPEVNFGAHMGDTFNWPKQFDMDGFGEFIGEFDDVPDGDFEIGFGTVTTGELTRSTTLSHLADLYSELSIVDAAVIALTNNWSKTIDRVVANVFRQCEVIYTPTGTNSSKTYVLSTTGTPGAVATRAFGFWDLRNVVEIMDSDFNIPGYQGDDYMCITTTKGLRGIREDTEFIDIKKYADPKSLLAGEVGRTEEVRFIKETNALTKNLTAELGEMVFFGDDPIVEIEVYPYEIQAAVQDQWGRFRSMRYTWNGGFARTWVYDDDDGQTRIVRVGSL